MPRAGLDAGAVVASAAALADAEGLERLTLAGVAAALGVRTPSLYAHLPGGLGELRARLGERGARELARQLQRAAAGRARGEALRSVAGAYRRYAHAHPGLYAAMQVPSELPGFAEAATDVVGAVLAVLAGYGLEGEPALHAVRAVRAGLHGFVTLEREGGLGLELSLDESFERLVAMLDAGLAGRAP